MPKTVAKCGTRSGYNRHLRLTEQVCLECRVAQNEYDRNRFDANQRRERYLKYPANPETRRARWRRYDAAKRGSRTEIYSEFQVIELYGTQCHLCHEDIDFIAPRRSGMGINWEKGFNVDHVIPISKGGSDTLDNVRPSHVLCNIKKGNSLMKNINKTKKSLDRYTILI